MDNILDNIETGFTDAVSRLQAAGAQFGEAYRAFIAIPAQYRSSDWLSIKSKADAVQGTISTITSAVDAAYSWLKNAFGLSGLNGLGIIVPVAPWLTVAAIGAAVSAIMAVYPYMVEEINKANYRAEMDAINVQRAKDGLPPLEYYIPENKGVFGNISDIAKWLVIGSVAIFIVPKVLQNFKERN